MTTDCIRKKMMAVLLVAFCFICSAGAEVVTHIDVSPTEELYCIHFDNEGLLWMGTSAGVKSYDGYAVREQFLNVVRLFPQTGSDVRSLTTDGDGHLWVGTNDGLVRIDRQTGSARLYCFPKQSQQIIYRLFTGSDGTVYVGTDDGFSIYQKDSDTFLHVNGDNAKAVYSDGREGRYAGWGVKDFAETATGDIIIGTWSQGIWHYSRTTGNIHAYKSLNWANSAYCLCIDEQNRLWIGTQGYGVQRLDRIDDYELQTLRTIGAGERDERTKVVYGLASNSILGQSSSVSSFFSIEEDSIYSCVGDTIQALTGPDGALWIATRSGGIVRRKSLVSFFSHYAQGGIRSIFTDDGRHFFLGYGMQGVAWLDSKTGELRLNNRVPGYGALPEGGFSTRITSIVRRMNGELWIAAGDNGIFISYPDGRSEVRYPSQIPYVKDNVTALYESRCDHTLWIGQRQGVSFLTQDGMGMQLDVKDGMLDMTGYFMVNHITEDHEGHIWISSANNGIVRVEKTGDLPSDSMRYRHYMTPMTNVTACFEDMHHRLWAISANGLLRYRKDKDCFETTARYIHLPGSKVLSVNEDQYGAIWLTTERALVRLDPDSGQTVCFTEQDGLPGKVFITNATFRYGDNLYFGMADGFVGYRPSARYTQINDFTPSLVITDIVVDGASVLAMDSLEACRFVSSQPLYTRDIIIPSSVKKFGIEFSLLTYSNQDEVQYTYRLDGFEKDWQYIDGRSHKVVFERIPSGTYQFHLRAADSYGRWYNLPYSIRVRVLSPWYATWWACLLYLSMLAILAWFVWHYLKMQRELYASRRFSTILQSVEFQKKEKADILTVETKPLSAPLSDTQYKNAEFIARATRLVRDHLNDSDYNRDRLAADLGLSVSTLYARLHECADLSIQIFIQTIRLNAACDILRSNPDIRISELAYRVGFNTPKYFSQCFKKEFGVLPTEYVKRKQG